MEIKFKKQCEKENMKINENNEEIKFLKEQMKEIFLRKLDEFFHVLSQKKKSLNFPPESATKGLESEIIRMIDEKIVFLDFQTRDLDRKEESDIRSQHYIDIVQKPKNEERRRRSSVIQKGLVNKESVHKHNLIKIIGNSNGGAWFHPREIINDCVLLTGGKDGVIKFWEIKNPINKFELINYVDTEVSWITSIKYDKRNSHIFASTYSEYLFVYSYDLEKNIISKLNILKTELSLIYGFDIYNKDFGFNSSGNSSSFFLACSGFTESMNTVFVFTKVYNDSLIGEDDLSFSSHSTYNHEHAFTFVPHQAIAPLTQLKSNHSKGKNYSKSLKFCEKLNLLLIGLLNGIIEVYEILSDENDFFAFSYSINLEKPDWVYQLQIISKSPHKNFVLASNANSLYLISFNRRSYKLKHKNDFLASIHDFHYIGDLDGKDLLKEREMVFIKIKTSMVLIYDLKKREVIDSFNENNNRGIYDHCLIVSNKEGLVFSCRDHDILVYNFN